MLLGPELAADTGGWGTWAWTEHLLGAPGYRIAGGTDEIQHNILAERVLGLPREPAGMSDDDFEHGLAHRVATALRRERPGLEVGALTRLPGGHSGLTYRVETSEGPLVVKSVPENQKAVGRHDMLRQARIISALAPTDVPVPAVVATDDTEPAWFAMQLVDGESLEPVLDDPAVQPSLAAAAHAPGRRDPAGTARRTPRQGAGRRRRRCPLATSWPAGPARWRPFRRTSCRTRTGCTSGWRTASLPRSSQRWCTATTGWAT